ncbi:TetR/AcrR family transcriptional regulator [Asticcacaulis sp. BYS171W]|uniref:TetR/AcrR family transcriptional regulator n=1 Tax=Asticcacaulis aquaticus TaxID=2984212 RepID=A0ABT5HTH8_9CAUL|nr:TetR/AcrR family transcriptional regulator [Asticcacaulis aquaticus]MDC7683368.1 TetR/AcrR family transcriptional regulator [Asticcacaulis aquaticus]
MSTQELRSRGDKDARREAILDVASDIFLEGGFDAASMSAIAARVGGSKGTLYNYFKSKEELFEAFVQRHCALHANLIDILIEAETGNYRETLTHWGQRYLKVVTSDLTQRNFRVIMAVAERWPESGRRFYENGPLRGIKNVAAFLQKGVEAGEYRIDDTLQAASQFIALCQNRYQKARFLNYMPEPTDDEIVREVEAALRTFYAAFGAK